jgi:hypothetical protein
MAHLANPRDQRDCMMAGAASGIAAAFSAPLGEAQSSVTDGGLSTGSTNAAGPQENKSNVGQ